MVRADTVILLTERPNAHGVLEEAEIIPREVYCEVRSVGQSEVYQARAAGLAPEIRLVLSQAFEYQGEKRCVFCGVRYAILRTYVTDADSIELTLEREEGNADVRQHC